MPVDAYQQYRFRYAGDSSDEHKRHDTRCSASIACDQRKQWTFFKPRSGRRGHKCPAVTRHRLHQVIGLRKVKDSRVLPAICATESRRTVPDQIILLPSQTTAVGQQVELDDTGSGTGVLAHLRAPKCRNTLLVDTQHMRHPHCDALSRFCTYS